MPWKKRLKTTPNDVRRAWLLAAPFALLGASKAEADTAFTNFAFPGNPALLPGGIARTQPDRIGEGFVSVREFGSITSGATCRATMQAAFDSGYNLYFPQGYYDINAAINMPEDNHQRTIRGSGPCQNGGAASGTIIRGNFRDYLWKSRQTYSAFSPVSSISGIAFNNSYNVPTPITQVDPPVSPGDPGTHGGNGCGCLYLNFSFCRITNFIVGVTSGVGLYFPGINNYVSTFVAKGGYGGASSAPFTCGIWSGSRVGNGKVYGVRYGIVNYGGPTLLSDMDIERCQWGVMMQNPLPFWDRNRDEVISIGGFAGGITTITGLNFETCGTVDSTADGAGSMYLKGGPYDVSGIAITASGQDGLVPTHHILLDAAAGSFEGIYGGGNANTAGIATKDYSVNYDCIFTGCSTVVQAGKPAWQVFQNPDDSFNRQSTCGWEE